MPSFLDHVHRSYLRKLQNFLTSANSNVITQKIGKNFPTVCFVYYCLLQTRSAISFCSFWLSSPNFGPCIYPILLWTICVIVSTLRPELFEFGQLNVFTSYGTVSHVMSHARHPRKMLTRSPNLKLLSYSLSRAVLVSVVEPQVTETQSLN